MTSLANFVEDGVNWIACEDFTTPTGGIALVSADSTVHLSKMLAKYEEQPDDAYYLGLGKKAAINSQHKRDALGAALLACNHSILPTTTCFSWADAANALPPIRKSGPGALFWPSWEGCDGVRTFVGSRSSSLDATFSDYGEDCSHNGFPSALGGLSPGYSVINWTAVHSGEGPITTPWNQYINLTAVADGLIGGDLPIVILYFPVLPSNPSHKIKGARYWTMVAAPVPDGGGRREQDVWFRFAMVECSKGGDDGYGGGDCKVSSHQYWENYWFTRTPGKSDAFGPEQPASAAGFYSNLLKVHLYWQHTKQAEGMATLSLPSTLGTNGTWLVQQATHSIIRSMISRRDTFQPSYGVMPGYGWWGQDGFQDVFTSTATMALEWGAMPFAKGVIDNQFELYVRHDGLVNYRAIEVPSMSRFLTLLALYLSYSSDEDLLIKHFDKAKALASWLMHRRKLSLTLPPSDPRYGIPLGNDEADSYSHTGGFSGSPHGAKPDAPNPWLGMQPRMHHLSAAAEMSRAFTEMGKAWKRVGASAKRSDITAHGAELLSIAPQLQRDFQTSLNRTVKSGIGGRCWANVAEDGCGGFRPRTYSEMMYSALLNDEQIDEIYRMGNGEVDCSNIRGCGDARAHILQVGSPAGDGIVFTHIPFGLAYGMLLADYPERFLLHYFSTTAHAYTRGSWTVPEEHYLDRDHPTIAYNTVGQTISPIYLKWMLVFEDPRSQTLWLGKALPREWLADGVEPVVVEDVPTRYGRVGYRLQAAKQSTKGAFTVHANLSLPASFAGDSGPAGGLHLRLRVPLHCGKMVGVSVGGKAWPAFDPKAEAIVFDSFTPSLLTKVESIVATFE